MMQRIQNESTQIISCSSPILTPLECIFKLFKLVAVVNIWEISH